MNAWKAIRADWAVHKDEIRALSSLFGGVCGAFMGVLVAPAVDEAVPQAPDRHELKLSRGPFGHHWAAYAIGLLRETAVFGGTIVGAVVLGAVVMARPSMGIPVMFGVLPAAVALDDRHRARGK